MKVPITKTGYERLKAEVARLKKVERPRVIADIAEARAQGDLSENAEYEAAKHRQSFIEGRLLELEDKLARAEVIAPEQLSTEKVVFGTTVHLLHRGTGEKKRYMLVGSEEANVEKGRISVVSPLGRALIGRRVGEVARVALPTQTVEYAIVAIRVEEEAL